MINDLICNPVGHSATPDGAGGIKYVRHGTIPQPTTHGCFLYFDAGGRARLARGPQPEPEVEGYNWRTDEAWNAVFGAPGAKRPVVKQRPGRPLPEPSVDEEEG
jgi:hypothetical protein